MSSIRILAVLLLACAAAARGQLQVERLGPIAIFRIEGVREFPEATAPGAIRRACAEDRLELQRFFAERRLALLPRLLRSGHGLPFCHLFYEPSVPGFRASADDEPISGVFGALDPASFVAGRKPIGDTLEVLKYVLAQAPAPLDVTLTINRDYDPRHWPAAVERHFGDLPHRVETRPSRAAGTQPWAQDYVKSGWAGDAQKLLVPYRLFEGRSHDGDAFRPLLDGLEDGMLARSQLSWEGGDLQLVRDPRDPARLILFHGDAARAYWGKNLDPEEYAYVLRTELGADASVDLSGLAAHVDYVTAFLPRDSTILLAWPARGDASLARASAQALLEVWGESAPASLRTLAARLENWRPGRGDSGIRDGLAAAGRDFSKIENDVEPDLATEIDAYTAEHCPGNDACFEGAGRAEMFERNPALLKRALDGIADMVVRGDMTPRLLCLIEAQLRAEPWPREALLARKEAELQALGFRVVRTPRLAIDSAGGWPGVSYANSLVWGRRVFVPAFGLGDYEDRLFRELAAQLPGYEIEPVPARYTLLRNGGVHCVFGLVRAKPELR